MRERLTVFAGQTITLAGVTIQVEQIGSHSGAHVSGKCVELIVSTEGGQPARVSPPPGAKEGHAYPEFRVLLAD